MSLGAAGRGDQRPMLRNIHIQDMGMGIDLRPNGNGRASALPASEKRVTADSNGSAAHVRYWPKADIEARLFWIARKLETHLFSTQWHSCRGRLRTRINTRAGGKFRLGVLLPRMYDRFSLYPRLCGNWF